MRDDPAVAWLLASEDPSVRYLTLTEVLDEPPDSPEAAAAWELIPEGPRVRALLSGQEPDGGFGVHPYRKWMGAHWRLVSLVDLGVPPNDPRARAATEGVLTWLASSMGRRRKINGLMRACASQWGNAIGVCCRLGLASDDRVRSFAEWLVEWQWADGGWNCDKRPEAHHSSFHETFTPLWGLAEYYAATGDESAREATERAAEFMLRHRLFRSERTAEVIDPAWLQLRYPPYWHYDVLAGLRVMATLDKLADPRAAEALGILAAKRLPDGRWASEGRHWKNPGTKGSQVEVVDWGRRGPNEMVTLSALRVLKAAGRLGSP